MKWQNLIDKAIVSRQELHRIPELCWEEYRTSEYLKKRLDEMNVQWRSCAETGVLAHVAQGAPGLHVALRADMDGLQLQEIESLPWQSVIPGQMHCCGHDGHMAVLLAVAGWLKHHEANLPGPVSFIFQPAEEGGHGAREMIKDGCLEGVDKIFGWHNWPSIPFGKAICPDGSVMAANGSFEILLKGRGGHASQPELCRDPVLAAAAVTMGLQQIVSRRLTPHSSGVVSVTSIDARSGETTVPETAHLQGSVRMPESDGIQRVLELIDSIARGIANGYGVKAEVTITPRYPAVVNDAGKAVASRALLEEILGPDWREDTIPVPIMASEDFSYYLDQIPGAFALVGAGDGNIHSRPCHNTGYNFNDALIEPMARFMVGLTGIPDPGQINKEL